MSKDSQPLHQLDKSVTRRDLLRFMGLSIPATLAACAPKGAVPGILDTGNEKGAGMNPDTPTPTASLRPTATETSRPTPMPEITPSVPWETEAEGATSQWDKIKTPFENGVFANQQQDLLASIDALSDDEKQSLQWHFLVDPNNDDVRLGLEVRDSERFQNKVILAPVTTEQNLLILHEHMSVEEQQEMAMATDVAGTHLAFRARIGETGIVRVDDFGRVLYTLNQEGAYITYAPEFDPLDLTDYEGNLRFSEVPAVLEKWFNHELAPREFNGGRIAYSLELKRIVYVDDNGNYVGLLNSKDSHITDEKDYWYGQEDENLPKPIKANGWGNVVFVYGNHPEYNWGVVVANSQGKELDPEGGEIIANAILSPLYLCYLVQNGLPFPDNYINNMTFFTDNPSVKKATIYKIKENGIYKNLLLPLGEPIILISAKDLVNDGLYLTPVNVYTHDKGTSLIVKNTFLKGKNEQEPLSGVFAAYIVNMQGQLTHNVPSNFYAVMRNSLYSRILFREPNDNFLRTNARIRTNEVK